MSSEAGVMPGPAATLNGEKRRGRRPAESKEKSAAVLFFLAEDGTEGERLSLKERFDSEGAAMVESLKRGEPYYRVEVWRSRAVVKGGAVAIEKEPVKAST